MIQNIPKEKILEVVKLGPTLPAKIAKAVGGDTMLIGAILSTLISTGDVKVSTLKIGGSPLYYVPEHESKLEDFIDHLNEKDRKTFRMLKEQKVLQDSAQDPLTRVSLRGIKDFAKQLEIELSISPKEKILFWRFYAVSKDEAYDLAKKSIKIIPAIVSAAPVVAESAPEHVKPVFVPVHEKSESTPLPIIENISPHVELQRTLDGKSESLQEGRSHEHKHAVHHERTQTTHHEKHEPKNPKQSKPKIEKTIKTGIDFFELIKKYVALKNLDIISKEKIKKSEYDLILKNHDNNEYIYCKAKDKSTVNEGDLAPAVIFAQNKKMPCLFITTGVLSKKTEPMLAKEFIGLRFEKIVV